MHNITMVHVLFAVLVYGALLHADRLAVWKSTSLPTDSIASVKTWNHTRVVSDHMCEAMAKRHKCSGFFRTDILNIMRADACRYMALYEFGGVYADLDVELKELFPVCNGLCVGKEYPDRDTLANYVILASQSNDCLLKAINLCCERLKSVRVDFSQSPHLVHLTCGPDAFTQACSRCAQVWSHAKLKKHVIHHIASVLWKNGYPSWIEERKNIAGWAHVYEH